MNHTPTPWKVLAPSRIVGSQKEGDRLIYNPETKEHIAETFQYRNDDNTDEKTSIDNAEFIVTACNAHEDLVEACKDLIASLKYAEQAYGFSSNSVKIGEQALAKAGVQ